MQESGRMLLPDFFAEHSVCVLARVGQVAHRLVEIRLETVGLKLRHYAVLRTLLEGDVMSQHELGTLLLLDPATTANTLDELEREGLATRRREPTNRRKYAVRLTPAGRRRVARAQSALGAL